MRARSDACYGDQRDDGNVLTLLDAKLAKTDAIQLGLAYHTGSFRLRDTGPGERLRFSFFADEIWQLDVASRPRLRLARPLGPVRYSSSFLAGHRLTLVRVSGP